MHFEFIYVICQLLMLLYNKLVHYFNLENYNVSRHDCLIICSIYTYSDVSYFVSYFRVVLGCGSNCFLVLPFSPDETKNTAQTQYCCCGS